MVNRADMMAMLFAETFKWGSLNVDLSFVLNMAITALFSVFVWWIKSDAKAQLASLKNDMGKEMNELREKMENKIVEAFDGKFLSIDVYKADKETENQRFQMMMDITNLKLDNVNKKMDEIVQAIKEIR